MQKVLVFLVIVIISMSCSQKEEQHLITNSADYVRYLSQDSAITQRKVINLQQEVAFWSSKIESQPNGFLYFDKMAKAYDQLFELTGEVTYLTHVDSLYKRATEITDGKWKTANFISLSSNDIKRHDFRGSLAHGHQAMENTHQKFGPLMMLFDSYMELGYYESAYFVIRDNKRLDLFDYLVRLSKYQDHVGNLDSAIVLMEKACEMVKYNNSPTTLWAKTNLADMYGHAGRLEDAYRNYLAVLEKDKNYKHALKGVAWLAYSNDKNPAAAQKIISSLSKRTELPDAQLLLSEIAEYEGDIVNKKKRLDLFMSEASKPKYGDMYHKYLVEIMAEEYQQYDKAIQLAKEEIGNRATPLTYSLLAWCYELRGDHETALDIMTEHVIGQTFEPAIIHRIGVIYLSNGKTREGIELLKEAEEASFELGPVLTEQIRALISVHA